VSTKETKEPLMKEEPESLEKFDTAMKKISTSNKTVLKSSVKTLLSTLQNLQKNQLIQKTANFGWRISWLKSISLGFKEHKNF